MRLPQQQDVIAGSGRPVAETGMPLANPNDGASLGFAAQSTPAAVDEACHAASRVSAAWGESSVSTRVAFLDAFAAELAARGEEIAYADAVDTGIPIRITRLFAGGLPEVVRGAGESLGRVALDRDLSVDGRCVRLLSRPLGPAAVIAPFNAPSFTIAKKSAYAIAAGCPVIAKPSPAAAHSAGLVAEAALEAAARTSTPAEVCQLVHGDADVAVALAGSPVVRAVAFTGGRAGGAAITAAASGHLPALQLECGSNNSAIVRADADPVETARHLVAGFTKLNGQWCERPGVAFVHATAYDPLRTALIEQLGALRVGSSLDPDTDFGPQANASQQGRVLAALERLEAAGATTYRAASAPSFGSFVMPTLVEGAPPAASVDEIFGPVLVLHRVSDDAEALALASKCVGGLAGYVFSRDIAAALHAGAAIRAGEVKINGTSVLDMHPASSQTFWDGSGIGGHGDEQLLRFFLGTRIVGVDLIDPPL